MAFVEVAANTLDDAFSISNSCRFNDGDSPDLDITSSDGNEDIWTWSAWVKRSALKASGEQFLFCGSGDGSNNTEIKFQNDQFTYINYDASSNNSYIRTTAKYRDVSAWYHLMVIIDMSQSTDTNRIKLYVNGVRNTTLDQTTYAGQNVDTYMNVASGTHRIGADARTAANYFDGYMAEMHFIDGTAKAHTDFGEFDEDSGIWKPKKYTGSYGTNGFYMEFKQTGTSANASGIGADTSGNGKHYTPANLAATDITTDTPSNNWCVWNALEYSGDTALAEGNTEGYTRDGVADYHEGARGTIAVSNGKWYWEVKMVEVGDTSNAVFAGIMSADHSFRNGEEDELFVGTYGMRNSDGDSVISNGSALAYATYGASFSDGDILNFALDMDNNRLYIGKGGQWADGSGNIDESSINSYLSLSTTPSAYMPMVIGYSTGAAIKYQANFGNAPHSISSGNADANGYGNFEYAVPSGYYALCTKNLAEYG